MSELQQFKTLQGLVKQVLQQYPETRDDDRILEMKIWFIFAEKHPDKKFSELYLANRLPLADTISRAGRKIKENCPELRGEHYAERKCQEQLWKETIVKM